MWSRPLPRIGRTALERVSCVSWQSRVSGPYSLGSPGLLPCQQDQVTDGVQVIHVLTLQELGLHECVPGPLVSFTLVIRPLSRPARSSDTGSDLGVNPEPLRPLKPPGMGRALMRGSGWRGSWRARSPHSLGHENSSSFSSRGLRDAVTGEKEHPLQCCVTRRARWDSVGLYTPRG